MLTYAAVPARPPGSRTAPWRDALPSRAAAGVDPTHRGVERWVARRLGTIGHERRVAEVATRLFHLTRPLHRLPLGDLRLLRLAALVHDVGRCVCDDTHPLEGARLLLTDPPPALASTERRHLAYLTRYHRGAVPAPGEDEVLLPGDDADRLRRVLALLRAADALDGRSIASPRLVFALVGTRAAPLLRITCFLGADCPKARKTYRRRKKFRLLEELFACSVEVEVADATTLAMVA